MKQKLSFANRIWIGFTLFSMFFGAGNLIFPPFIGYSAGHYFWRGLAGFILSAVCLPVLGVGAVALSGGLDRLTARVHPKFSLIFPLLIYLSIGPLFAIPRAALASYEMAILPFLGQTPGKNLRFIYTLFFFTAAYLISLHPEKLSHWLGKIMAPCLFFLIALIFVGCVCWPVGQWTAPLSSYRHTPVLQGFLEGYQTMDALASLSFGIILASNIRAKGVTNETFIARETVRSSVLAGFLLTLIYGALAYIGSLAGTGLPGTDSGASILTWAVNALYGRNGLRILAVIFFIACFNVGVSLICCCGEYFSRQFPALPYPVWSAIFSCVGLTIANGEITRILAISLPVIRCIYPIVIVLIILSLFHPWISCLPQIYPCCILATALASIAESLGKIPGSPSGFFWLLPALAGALVGTVCSCLQRIAKKNKEKGEYGYGKKRNREI